MTVEQRWVVVGMLIGFAMGVLLSILGVRAWA